MTSIRLLRLPSSARSCASRAALHALAVSFRIAYARARVIGNYDKKGHRFVELDALVVANGTTPLAHCHHIAIYQPREQAAA